MDLFLMQHGEALAESADPLRPLTAQGRRSVDLTARRAAQGGVALERIVHSGKARAEQSAAILAGQLRCPTVEQRDGLAPSDSVTSAAQWIEPMTATGALAVVGHLPFLDRLAGLLVAGDERIGVVAFRNGGLVHLVSDDAATGPGSWRISWVVTPDIA